MAEFDPAGFIVLADSLQCAAREMSGNNQDAAFRAAAGRYYYGCFLSIYKACGLGGDDFGNNGHSAIIGRLIKSKSYNRTIGNHLSALKDIRADADYYVDKPIDSSKIEMAEKRAKDLISLLPHMKIETIVS